MAGPAGLQVLNNFTLVLDATFQEILSAGAKEQKNWVDPHMKVVDSTDERVGFIWLGAVADPAVVDVRSPRTYENILGYTHTLTSEGRQAGIKVPIEKFHADKTGMIMEYAQQLAARFANLNTIMASRILNLGNTAAIPTHDGLPLYDNAHVIGNGTFDNLLAGTGTLFNDIETAYVAMAQFQDDRGNIRDGNFLTHMVVPSSYSLKAPEVQNNTLNPNATFNTENRLRGVLDDYIVAPRLTDVTDSYFFRSAGGEKPFILIRNPELDTNALMSEFDPKSEAVRFRRQYEWWIEAHRSLFPTHPHLHARVVVAG